MTSKKITFNRFDDLGRDINKPELSLSYDSLYTTSFDILPWITCHLCPSNFKVSEHSKGTPDLTGLRLVYLDMTPFRSSKMKRPTNQTPSLTFDGKPKLKNPNLWKSASLKAKDKFGFNRRLLVDKIDLMLAIF